MCYSSHLLMMMYSLIPLGNNYKIFNEKWNTFIVFLVLVFISGSCGELSDQDFSLTPEEYRNQGMPDYSRLWNYEDYENAIITLDKIKAINPLSLPKKDSEKSGKYFHRMINPDNMSFFTEETLPLYERAYQLQTYVDIIGYLTEIYTDLDNTEQYYDRELIELYIFGLVIIENMLDLGNQINESVDEEDIKMQSGFRSIQYIYITMVLFVLENQQKSSLFEVEDLERLSDVLYNSVSDNRSWMEASAVKDIKQKIQEVIDNTSSEHIRGNYNILIEIL